MNSKNNIDQSKFVFLFGISVRSGTNFSARIFLKHPDVEVVPKNETIREFPLLKFIDKFKITFEQFKKTFRTSEFKLQQNIQKIAERR